MDKKSALITGGGRGLGRALSVAFATAGYNVAMAYSSHADAATKTASDVRQIGAEALTLQGDVSQSASAASVISAVEKKWGRIDVLVNNAGVTRDRTIVKMSDDEWTSVINTNLNGPFYMTRAVLPIMARQKSGSILNISSYLATRPVRGAANYAASKAGLISLTKSTAIEGGPDNVRANAIMPGFHVTDMNRTLWTRIEKQIREQHLLATLPDAGSFAKFAVQISELTTVSGQVFSFESRLV